MKNNFKKNVIYNTLLIFFNISYPLITSPYISRVLRIKDIGELNFANSLVTMFIVATSLGIPIYGLREVAKNKNNKSKLQKIFSELIITHFIFILIGILVYLLLVFNLNILKENKIIYIIYIFNLGLSLFTLDWFYMGLEEYEYITKRSILVKGISIILMFIFVKNEQSYIIFAIISVFGNTFNNIFNLFNSFKFVKFKLILPNIKKIFYKTRFFYMQSILISSYQYLDQIILNILSNSTELAYYTRARQISGIVSSVVLSLVKTLIPRVSFYFENDFEKYKEVLNFSFNTTCFLAFPATVGLFILSEEISLLLGGQNFILTNLPLKVMSFLVIVVSMSVFLDTQISTPSSYEKNTFYSSLMVAFSTFILNFKLMSKYGAIGGAISILFGECIGVVTQILLIKKEKLYLEFLNLKIFKYILSSIIMGIVIYPIQKYIDNLFLSIGIVTVIGAITYGMSIEFFSKKIFKENSELDYFKKIICRNKV